MPSATSYEAKSLPFHKDLIGISKKTVEIHHDKLYQGYVAKMKEIAQQLSAFAKGEKEATGNQTYSELRALRNGETFANNGVYLHEYYFNGLGGEATEIPMNALTEALKEKFGSVDQFISYFSASGMAMRGWVVLAWDVQLQHLKVYGADAHNQGGVWGCLPIVVLDVYEHAYFIDYGSDRAAYIKDYWKNFNWEAANHLYEKVKTFSL
ncbi:superoxide dismutase [Candidatus Uhrbacteria bacterium]|nr:superoxide dismutase [Candidatus Uhrbacteria bacterium]